MAQPKQVFGNGYEYSVIDNGAAGVVITANGTTTNNWAASTGGDGLNPDGCVNGSNSQYKNAFKNGTIPDFLAAGTTTVLNSPASATVIFKNPA